MANRVSLKRHVDPDIFKEFIKSKGMSIRQLGIYCDANERTIRRMLDQRQVTLTIAFDICQVFDCDFNDIFGPDDSNEWKEAKNFLQKKIC
jgi:DNA-binding XRE family transcriptional regulator